jgi:hypothetical protein
MNQKETLIRMFKDTVEQYIKNLNGNNYSYAKQSLDLAFQILDKINELP